MAQVYTDLGPGEIIASETVRGRTSHRVAGRGFDKWFDETEVGRIAGMYGEQDGPVFDSDPGYFDAPRSHFHDDVPMGGGPARHPQQEDDGHLGHEEEIWGPNETLHIRGNYRQAWAPMNNDNSVNLPYDPRPQYPAIPGDTESTLQPIHRIDADERTSPADSITFDDRDDDESEIDGTSDVFENRHAAAFGLPSHGGAEAFPEDAYPPGHAFHDPDAGYEEHEPSNRYHPSGGGEGWTNEHGAPAMGGFDQMIDGPPSQGHGLNWEKDPEWDGSGYSGGGHDEFHPSDAYGLEKRGPEDIYSEHQGSTVHDAFAFLIPLAEGAAAAMGGAGASGAASAAAGGLARGVGSEVAQEALGGGEGDPAQGGGPAGMMDQALQQTAPGDGWGELQRGASLDSWLASREVQADSRGAGLSDRYIDVTASADYHNDPVQQFRHDPSAYISRVGHVESEPVSPEMEHYGQLVESNPQIREAAWKDVRAKAMRLRREGRVSVKDVAPDRIYASVEGDHGIYDVMIAKEGAFGGFGGGHSISNWRCGCEWGRWAFQRQHTYIGRLCSHGYAAYMTMQSAHMKGQERAKKLTRPYKKRADALQNTPQRLVPEMVINDTDDAHTFLDVTDDDRKDTGPDDVVSEQDIVHFARVMAYCDRNDFVYPRELTAFLYRHAGDDSPSDWQIEDAGKAAGSALEEIRDWADKPQSQDYGHMEERNDDIRDAVDKARDGGTDASMFTAGVHFRTAAPSREESGRGNKGSDRRGDGGPAEGVTEDTTPVVERQNAMDAGGDPTGTYTNQDGRAVNRQGVPVSGTAADNAAEDGAEYSPLNNQAPSSRDSGGVPAPGGGGGGDRNPAIPGNQNYAPDGSTGAGTAVRPGQDASAIPGGVPAAQQGTGVKGTGDGVVQPGEDASSIPGGVPAAQQGVNTGSDAIGQGDYNIQSGDTLADIAQRSGYGDNYQALGDANGITDYDKINAGDSLKIGDPGAGAAKPTPNDGVTQPGEDASNIPGGVSVEQQNAMSAPATPAAPAATPAAPAATTPVDTSAAGGSPAGTGVDTAAAAPSAGGAADASAAPVNSDTGASASATPPAAPATPATTDTSTANGGAGSTGMPGFDTSSMADIAGTIGDVAKSFLGNNRNLFADQADYNEWVRYAYPDATKSYNHTPFNGSGGDVSIEFGTSEEYVDKARKDMDDVEDLEHHNVNETDERFRSAGVKRLGGGRRRPPVVPTVVREQRVPGQRVEAQHIPDDFDPLSRTAADFEDPYAGADESAIHTAAAGNDFVAEFQRNFGSSIMSGASGGGGGHFDDFANSPAVRQAMMRTAGRNYSLAEQADLIREGDRGGAGNLASLDLAGTHYEHDMRDARDSVGLW